MGSEGYPVAEEAVSYIPMDPCFLGKQGRSDKKRRFSEEQIKSLESIFECQAKLEPRKKLQLARELGLQPRQVAIWFQNKRARWKSKQLEQEYAALRADHDALLSSVESLKKEKQLLIKQLQKLSELLKKASDESSNNGDSENRDGKGREDVKPGRFPTEDYGRRVAAACSDEEENKFGYGHHEEAELLYMGEPGSGYLTSIEQRCDFNSGSSPEPCGAAASEWWEFWPLTEANPVVSESM